MKTTNQPPMRAIKRLSEAIGYVELGMTRQAAASLQKIGDAGPVTAVVEMLRAEIARREQRFEDAAESLEAAARVMPDADGRPLWLALSQWHRHVGNTDRAIDSLAHARGAH